MTSVITMVVYTQLNSDLQPPEEPRVSCLAGKLIASVTLVKLCNANQLRVNSIHDNLKAVHRNAVNIRLTINQFQRQKIISDRLRELAGSDAEARSTSTATVFSNLSQSAWGTLCCLGEEDPCLMLPDGCATLVSLQYPNDSAHACALPYPHPQHGCSHRVWSSKRALSNPSHS